MPGKRKPRPYRSLRKIAETEGVTTERLLEEIRAGRLRAYRFGERDVQIYDTDFEAWKASRQIPSEAREA